MNKSPRVVWLVEREFICPRKLVPVAVPPSATKKDAEAKRDLLPDCFLYIVTPYRSAEDAGIGDGE